MLYRLCLILVLTLIFKKNYAQTVNADSVSHIIESLKEDTLDQKIYKFAETEPYFPGSKTAWLDFVKTHMDNAIAKKNMAPEGIYRIIISFVVDKDGRLRNIVRETKNGFGMENEVIRVITCSPRWIPATNNGCRVNYAMRLPVTFFVGEN